MTTDTLRQITGVLRTPEGSAFPNKTLTWFRERRVVQAQGSSVVLDEPFYVVTDAAGAIDHDVMAGNYLVLVRLKDTDRYFRLSVPDQAGPFNIADLVDTPPVTPEIITQVQALVIEARAWAQNPENTEVVAAGQYSALHHAARAAASAAEAALYEGPWLDDVAAIGTDSALTMTPGQPGTVVLGDIVRTRKEGFAFKVVSSGEHRTTAGGVKLEALLMANGQYSEAQFASLATAFEVAARAKKPLVLSGHYTVSGQLLGILSGDAELHLRLSGDVTIEVDPSASWFRELILLQTDTINNVSITGGSMTIIGNKKISAGLWLRHIEAADGGTVNISAPVAVLDLEGPVSPAVAVGGIVVQGRYRRIVMQSPRVEDVTRLSTGGECSGISCSGFVGDVEIYSPVTKRIFTGPSLVDADGVKTFGFAPSGGGFRRSGRVRIYDPVYENCQGRSFKDQCGDTIVYRPRVIRDAAVVQQIANGNEFDFQTGGGLVLDPIVEYTSDGGTSPLGASSAIVVFQHNLEDAEMFSRISNLTMISDTSVPRIAIGLYSAAAQRSFIEIDCIKLIPKAGFTGSMISRAVFETNMGQIASKATKTRVKIRGVDGPNNVSLFGYVEYTTGDLTDKLSWSVTDCTNPLGPQSAVTRPFHNLSGNAVLAVEEFEMRNNNGYRDLYVGAWALDFRKLSVGTVITVDIAEVNATNPPPWGVSGFAHIRCEGQWFGNLERTVYVMKDNGANLWATRDGGANWGVIK